MGTWSLDSRGDLDDTTKLISRMWRNFSKIIVKPKLVNLTFVHYICMSCFQHKVYKFSLGWKWMSFQDSCQCNVHLSFLSNQKHRKGLFVLFIYVMERSNYFPPSFSLFHGWENFYMERPNYLGDEIRNSTSYIVSWEPIGSNNHSRCVFCFANNTLVCMQQKSITTRHWVHVLY